MSETPEVSGVAAVRALHQPYPFEWRAEEQMGQGAARYQCVMGDGFWTDERRDGHLIPCATVRALDSTP